MLDLADRLAEKKRFAVADQVVRAAVSVPANIAEGQGRTSVRGRRHYLVQARGSLYELETHLEIVARAQLAAEEAGVNDLIAQIGAGLSRLIERYDSRL